MDDQNLIKQAIPFWIDQINEIYTAQDTRCTLKQCYLSLASNYLLITTDNMDKLSDTAYNIILCIAQLHRIVDPIYQDQTCEQFLIDNFDPLEEPAVKESTAPEQPVSSLAQANTTTKETSDSSNKNCSVYSAPSHPPTAEMTTDPQQSAEISPDSPYELLGETTEAAIKSKEPAVATAPQEEAPMEITAIKQTVTKTPPDPPYESSKQTVAVTQPDSINSSNMQGKEKEPTAPPYHFRKQATRAIKTPAPPFILKFNYITYSNFAANVGGYRVFGGYRV
jgi:hypothetical protein